MKSKFHIVGSTVDKVFLVDDNTDVMSVTNDAENVTEYVNRLYPQLRIVYRDSDGRWDELVHNNGTFTGFAPYREENPYL
jgi:hypothetical protein